MKIIKVNATDSTNSYLKRGLRNGIFDGSVCVWALQQTNGKGQRGTQWYSKAGENLTFSLYFKIPNAVKSAAFTQNMLVTLAMYKVLNTYNLPQLKIKWPNDIMAANKKIGGILIENTIQNAVLSETIIGIGLNVNQENFNGLPKASSIKNILGISLTLETLLNKIIVEIENSFINYHSKDFDTVKNQFEAKLFRLKKPSTFIIKEKEFPGIIKGITEEGLLKILHETGENTYDLKDVELKY